METFLFRYGLAAVFVGGAVEGDATFTLAGVLVHLGLLHLPTAIAVGTFDLLITIGRLLSNNAMALIGEVRRIELWLVGGLILSISTFLFLRSMVRRAMIANKN